MESRDAEVKVGTLHVLERKILSALRGAKEMGIEEISSESQMSVDQVRRGLEWLKEKRLIDVNVHEERSVELGQEGIRAVESGLPERRLVVALKELGGTSSLKDLSSKAKLSPHEFSAALGSARTLKWVEVRRQAGETFLHLKQAPLTPEERLLKTLKSARISELPSESRAALLALSKRPNYIVEKISKEFKVRLTEKGLAIGERVQVQDEVDSLTPEMIATGGWREINLRPLDVEAPAPLLHSGRKHPVQRFIDEVREIFISLGFEEIDGPIVQLSFWNFDALFTPQDHPAREIQDTFYLRDLKVESPADRNLLNGVASVHESGGETGSRGWGYRWEEELAKRLVLRTHTTAVTVRYLAEKRPEEARVFSVGRVFRNEKVTFKNLVEFHQIEGIAVGKRVTLREMMGLLNRFYERLGLKKVRFWPSYFPYTEPSLQSMVYHEKLEKWVELCGMGIFRPEVTLPLGVKNPVLAWGGGLERLVMLRHGIDDVRYLYSGDLGWLRRSPLCP